jgi:hypothetical protein
VTIFLLDDSNALVEQAVECFVVGDHVGGFETLDLANRLGDGVKSGHVGNGGIKADDGRSDTAKQQNILKGIPFWRLAIMSDSKAVQVAVPFRFQLFDGEILNGAFSESSHHYLCRK